MCGCKSRRTDLPEGAQYLQKQIFAKPPSQSRWCNSGRAGLAGQYEQASLYPEGCVREVELADPGQTIIHFGKMKDKTIAEVWKSGPAGQEWVRWAANTDGKGYDPQGKP
ncbi:hypothetical protein [Bellilinea caldifistulae]|uniref:Uncharacterized protein n=1 Tax=Bellilinea caldifistulae TaxID=360411 RepID=A0A0P6WXY3_9CHLR|nr:hypothetical protein [Bellilinea caldifistulae]KPL71245.1 hypothetical protein AC812_16460 [Bellilinea caldifistulae]